MNKHNSNYELIIIQYTNTMQIMHGLEGDLEEWQIQEVNVNTTRSITIYLY